MSRNRTRKPFPASTTGRYIPGVGITLTKANVRAYLAEEAKAKRPEPTHAEIAAALVRKPVARRHLTRAANLYLAL